MSTDEAGDHGETVERMSLMDVALALAAEWRVILAGLVVGSLFSAVAYLNFKPAYSSHLVIQVGNTHGEHAPIPLEPPFMTARRIELRFGGIVGRRLATRVYENDFDLRKRLSLEVSVTSDSPEGSLALAWQIIDFVREDHERLYRQALARAVAANELAERMASLEERLALRYREFVPDSARRGGFGRAKNDVDELFLGEIRGWAQRQELSHAAAARNFRSSVDRNQAAPTTVVLAPDRDSVSASVREPKLMLASVCAGLFFGIVGAAFVAAWRRSRMSSAFRGNTSS